jgi:hypothetical protein
MNALNTCWTALVCLAPLTLTFPCAPVAALLLADSVVCQEKKQDPPKNGNDILDAEREKLRMKDVEGWKKLPIKSMDQVFDVKKGTQPLELPASITEEEKTKFAAQMEKAKDGGAKANRALHEIEKMGYSGLVLIINQLRDIDYKDADSAVFGMQLNASLTTITMGVNTGYVAVEVGEPMDPRKAHYNALTVQEWQRAVKVQWPTKEKFDEYIKNRKLKKDSELETEMGDKPDPKGKKEEPKKDEKKEK